MDSNRVVKVMLRTRPYNTWPLHVKLFTQEAVEYWDESISKLPEEALPGFTASVELEGVDGLSGNVGSGREGPIDVMDRTFGLFRICSSLNLDLRTIHFGISRKEHEVTCFQS